MNNYLADTTVIVDHLRGDKKATIFLKEFNPAISIVTIAELVQGARDKREQALAVKICTSLLVINTNGKISALAIELMKKFYLSDGLKFLDALIAASALENKLILATGNLKHFRFIKGLQAISQEEAFAIS